MQFCHKVADSVLPTRNRIYCPSAGKPKLQFATKKAAEAFIAYCADSIMAQNGYAPVRSYKCNACQCYHVSSQQKVSKSEVEERTPKTRARTTHRTLNRMEKTLGKAFNALAARRTKDAKDLCGDCLDLYEKCLHQAVAVSRRERLWEKLNRCVVAIAAEEERIMRDLLRLEHLPQRILIPRWNMTKSAV